MTSCGNGEQISFLNLISMKIVDFFSKCCFTGIVYLFISIPLFSQIKVKGTGNEAFRPAINNLYRFLKTARTDLSLAEERIRPGGVPLYDNVVDTFFEKLAMTKYLSDNEVHIRIQYQTIYSIDKMIDYIPIDSVFAMTARYCIDSSSMEIEENDQITNRIIVGFVIADGYFPMLDIGMNDSKQFLYILPFLYFDQERGKVLGEFIRRHQKGL